MALHKALTIPDILCEVFKHLSIRPQLSLPGADLLGSFEFPNATVDQDDFQASKAKRSTLACAARTCKVFSEPASSILWEVLDDLPPIESMLRDAHMAEGEEQAHVWKRIEQIARRIRALSTSCSEAQTPSEGDAFSPICSRYDGRPLFPNLRILSVYRFPGHSFLRIACASPALVLFTTATVDSECDLVVLKILGTVADARQELIHLKAFWLRYFDEEGFRAVEKFSNLRTAHFMYIDTTLFCHLATLPNLRTLHGQFAVSNPIQVMDIRGGFPALQELSTQYVDDRTSRCFLAVLPLISCRSLARLSLRITVLPEDIVQYLDHLCSSPVTAQLRKLDLLVDIAWYPFDNQGEPPICVTFASDVLAPLKPLRALTDISAVVDFPPAPVASFVVHDEDLDAVASAWPGLTRAKFGHEIGHRNDDESEDGPWGVRRPSLGAVIALAERCRELESVDVEFADVGARDLVQLEARADACAEPQTALRRIVFDPDSHFCYTLRVEDPPRLAAALRRLFPNLRGGLEMLQPQGEAEDFPGMSRATYRGWYPSNNMNTDAFRLLKALDDVHLES